MSQVTHTPSLPGLPVTPGDAAVNATLARRPDAMGGPRALVWFGAAGILLTLGFARPLFDLIRFALDDSLFSHVLLIPFVFVYLIRAERARLPRDFDGPRRGAAWPLVGGVLLLAAYWGFWRGASPLPMTDYLAIMTSAYLILQVSLAWACFGTAVIRSCAFPITFLVFMIPWPTIMINAVETGLQYASTEVAAGLLSLTGTPFLRDGRVFELPGITIQVAQECSGVRSSYVLLITSVLAAHLMLRTRWKRWALTLFVLPLGILRNGFRVLTISLLCAHVSPEMIDSPIHHSGGPLFFALSLIPFFLLLVWLRKSEASTSTSGLGGNGSVR